MTTRCWIALWGALATAAVFPGAASATITDVKFTTSGGLRIEQQSENELSDEPNRNILVLSFEVASPPDGIGLIVVQEGGGATILPTAPCFTRSPTAVVCPNPRQGKIQIFTGRGEDNVSLSALTDPPGKFVPVEVDGGGGSDSLVGSAGADTLNGDGRTGTGADAPVGTGNDILRGEGGNDTLIGEGGKDWLFGSTSSGGPATEHNLLDGGPGADLFFLGPSIGADEVRGGANGTPAEVVEHRETGFGIKSVASSQKGDVATYETRVFSSPGTAGVTVNLDASPDGAPGEGDLIGADVEILRGTARDDTLTGDGAANDFEGMLGKDKLIGKAGDDTLRLLDGVADDCPEGGTGTNVIFADLADQPVIQACAPPPPPPAPKKKPPLFSFEAVDETTEPAIVGARLSVRGTNVRVPLKCPRSPQAACAGTLSISPLKSRKAVARLAYRVRVRRSGSVTLSVGRAALAKLRRSGGAVLTLVEKGHSKKGPKTVEVARRLPA